MSPNDHEREYDLYPLRQERDSDSYSHRNNIPFMDKNSALFNDPRIHRNDIPFLLSQQNQQRNNFYSTLDPREMEFRDRERFSPADRVAQAMANPESLSENALRTDEEIDISVRVAELERQRIESFTGEEFTGEIESMESMQQRLQEADEEAGMRSAIVYLTLQEQDGVEGVEIIMVPGDSTQKSVRRFVETSEEIPSFSQLLKDFDFYVSTPRGRRRNKRRKATGKLLYDSTFDTIAPDLEALGIDHLQIIPDREFQKTPFSALVTDPNTQEYLIDRYSTAVSPSFQLTNLQHHDIRNAERLTLAESEFPTAGDLKFALPEYNAAQGTNQTSIPENHRFNQDNLEAILNSDLSDEKPQIIHLISHAQYKPGDDFDDDFFESTDSGEQRVTLAEILDYDLSPFELMFLNGCESAKGDEFQEYGLAGAAWSQGAESVVGGLWLVGDETTAMMMQTFYSRLSEQDLPIAKRLREAQLELRQLGESNEFSHPYFWSALQVIGSGH